MDHKEHQNPNTMAVKFFKIFPKGKERKTNEKHWPMMDPYDFSKVAPRLQNNQRINLAEGTLQCTDI